MSSPTAPNRGHPMNRLSIGGVIQTTFKAFAANFVAFTIIALIVYLPWKIVELLIDQSDGAARQEISYLGLGGLVALSLFVSGALVAAVVFGTLAEVSGQRAPTKQNIWRGLAEVPPSLPMAFVAALVISIGYLLFIVPGLFLTVVFVVVLPVHVVERTGFRESFERSWQLTLGHRWQIFGVVILFSVIVITLTVVFGFLSLIVVGIASVPAVMLGAPVLALVLNFLLTYLGQAVAGVLMAVLSCVLYYELRLAQDRGDDDTAAVFD